MHQEKKCMTNPFLIIEVETEIEAAIKLIEENIDSICS
jgi:hypothetical protein